MTCVASELYHRGVVALAQFLMLIVSYHVPRWEMLESVIGSGGDLCWRLGGRARVSSAVGGARIEAPKAGHAPSPEKFSIFELEKVSFGAFWVLPTFAVELNENWLGY